MQIELNSEQLSYLKGLNSKKKQRKFLLDCLVENLIGEPKRENFKNDHENILSKMEETRNDVLSLKSANLSIDQISAVVNWMNGYEQLKDTVIPIRFREDAVSEKSESLTESVKEFLSDENILKMNGFEKVDLSKELYLTCGDSVLRVTDFASGRGFGSGSGIVFSECSGWSWCNCPELWRKSTPQEIESMLIKKLEADGLKVGCSVNRYWFNSESHRVRPIHELNYYYDADKDVLECYSRKIYEKGKFAKIIPQEKEETKDPSKEYLNQSNIFSQIYNKMIFHNEDEKSEIMQELKRLSNNEILVVDFENVSESIPK